MKNAYNLSLQFILILALFTSCDQKKDSTENISADQLKEFNAFFKKGKEVALAAKTVLGRNLMMAIQRDGTEYALHFCNERAIALTDSTGTELNAEIRRVSDKNRNDKNVANKRELAYIEAAKEAIQEGRQPKPQVKSEGEFHVGYYPIITNAMCLQCHGTPNKDINENTLNAISEHYPNDKAKGYGINELRGIWVIKMHKDSKFEE